MYGRKSPSKYGTVVRRARSNSVKKPDGTARAAGRGEISLD